MKDSISFEEVKQIFRDSIDDSANINELLQNVANRIYLKGKNETLVCNDTQGTNSGCWNCNHCHDSGALSGWFCDIHGDLNKCNRLVYRCGAWAEKREYKIDAKDVT